MGMQWYLLQVHTNCEYAVQRNLQEIITRENLQDVFGQIIIPSEEVSYLKLGQKIIEQRKLFPNYIMIEMEFSDKAWHIVKKIPKVSKFVGGDSKPTPLKKLEVEQILGRIEKGHEKPMPKIEFSPGESIRINEGPFASFEGFVESVNYERAKLKVSVTIFGRSTPVELDFSQISKT